MFWRGLEANGSKAWKVKPCLALRLLPFMDINTNVQGGGPVPVKESLNLFFIGKPDSLCFYLSSSLK